MGICIRLQGSMMSHPNEPSFYLAKLKQLNEKFAEQQLLCAASTNTANILAPYIYTWAYAYEMHQLCKQQRLTNWLTNRATTTISAKFHKHFSHR